MSDLMFNQALQRRLQDAGFRACWTHDIEVGDVVAIDVPVSERYRETSGRDVQIICITRMDDVPVLSESYDYDRFDEPIPTGKFNAVYHFLGVDDDGYEQHLTYGATYEHWRIPAAEWGGGA